MASFFKEQTRTEFRKINENYRRRLDQLKQQQKKQRQQQARQHSQESQDRAREIAEGRDAERYDPDAFRKDRQDQKREEFRETARDISKKKPKAPRGVESSGKQERPGERDRSEERQRERQRQRSRRRGPRPKGPKPPRFRR